MDYTFNTRRLLRRIFGFLLVCLVLICLLFAMAKGFLTSKVKTPFNYLGSTWECDNPSILLTVQENTYGRNYALPGEEECFIDTKNGVVSAYVIFDTQSARTAFYFKDKVTTGALTDDALLFEGSCRYLNDRVLITIYTDYCFENEYDSIVLKRTN